MTQKFPVITIQCDWNEVIRSPNSKAWISSKYYKQTSIHDELTTTVNEADGKIKICLSDNYEYVSHANLSLVLKHMSGLKVAFIAPTKAHKVHDKGITSMDVAENSLAVSACEANKLLVWDSRTSEVLLTLDGHCSSIYKCRFFPSGLVVLSAGADGCCRIWSAETGVNPVTLQGHKMAVSDVAIVDRGRNLITVSRDGSAKLWDVGESQCLGNVLKEKGPFNCCALASSSDDIIDEVESEREIATGDKLLVVGSESGSVFCAHVAKREERFSKYVESSCNACTIFEQSAIVGLSNGKILQLSLVDGNIMKDWHESASPVLSMVSLPNHLLVVGRQDGTCTVLALQPERPTRVQLTGSDCDGIRDVSFNGKWIFAACRDSYVRKYDYNQVIVHFK